MNKVDCSIDKSHKLPFLFLVPVQNKLRVTKRFCRNDSIKENESAKKELRKKPQT